MNSNVIKKLAGSCALLGAVLSASAGPLPSGSSPGTTTTPLGLVTSPEDSPASPWYPTPSGHSGVPVTFGQELFASGGDVTVTFLGPTGAGYDEELFVASPNDGVNGLFMDNHSTANGTTFDLGTFAAGTEIEFGLDVLSTGNIWYDGPGSRNSDGDVHAYMVNDYEGLTDTTYVGFEDEAASLPADFNYIDEVYAFTGASAVSTPDASSTLPLLGMGLTALAGVARRIRK
jgi:hypothetical protein